MKEKREKQLPPPTKKRTGGRIFFLRVISRVERDPRRPKIRGADRGRDLAVISATVYGDAGDAVGFRICATHGRTKSHRNRWYLNVSLRATNTALVALGIPDCACLASVLFALNILFFALQCFAVASFTAPSLFFSGSFASWRIFFVFYFQFLFSSTNLRCSYASFYIDRFGTRRDSPRRNTFPNKQKKWHFQVFLKWFSSLRGRRGGSIFERIKRNAQLLKINFTHFSGGISNWSSEIGKKKIRNISFQIVISSSGGGRVKFWWFFKCGIAFIFRTKFAFCWFFPSRTCFDWEFIFKKK